MNPTTHNYEAEARILLDFLTRAAPSNPSLKKDELLVGLGRMDRADQIAETRRWAAEADVLIEKLVTEDIRTPLGIMSHALRLVASFGPSVACAILALALYDRHEACVAAENLNLLDGG